MNRRRKWAAMLLAAMVAASCTSTRQLTVTRVTTRSEAADPSAVDPAAARSGVAGPGVGPAATTPGGRRSGEGAVAAAKPARVPGGADRVLEGPIRIGVLSTLSGGTKFVGEPPYKIALGYAERLNAHGGINGRKLEVYGYDVCTNCPDEGLAQAKKAVEKDNVFALANTFVVNASLDQVVPYLNDKGVPMIQGSSGSQSKKPELSPYNFSVGFTIPGRAAVGADYAKEYLTKAGKPLKVALLYFTDALTSHIADEQRAALKRVGIQIVDEEAVSYDATMTNQSSEVVKMRAAGAEMVIGSHGVLCAFNMQAATQAGWPAPYLCTIMYDPFTATIAGHAALENRDVFADTEGYATADMIGPGIQDYVSLMKDYYPGGDVGLVTLYSYLGMRLIEEGVRSMGANVTRAGLAHYLESLRAYDAGGLTAPFSLGPKDHGSITGAQIVKLLPDGTFKRMSSDWVYPSAVHHLPGPVS